MESGSAVTGSSTRKENPHKKQKANDGEDIISSKLPESLISRILSFLPTKDAVRTCVLSKRWIHRWTSITKLELDDSVFYSPRRKAGAKESFVNFVYRALLLTNGSGMESFSLVMANKYDVSLLNTWISNILNRSLNNLRIGSSFELPFSALTSRSLFNSVLLEELVLEMCCAIKIPLFFANFGHLKLLKLSGIKFTMGFPGYYLRLRLPVLKKIETKNCTWLSAKGVTIEAPLLESVFIDQDLLSASHQPRSCKITFSASHLKEFTYCGYVISHSFILTDPSSAHNASVSITLKQCVNRVLETGSRAFLLLEQFSQVKCIKFDGLEVLTQQNVADLPVFAMLSHLELGLVTCEVLLGLLQKLPVLKTLVLKGMSI